jgi:hypothetical protein
MRGFTRAIIAEQILLRRSTSRALGSRLAVDDLRSIATEIAKTTLPKLSKQ